MMPTATVVVANGATRNMRVPGADVASGAVFCAVGAGGVVDTEVDTEADTEVAWADTEVMEDGERRAVMEVTVAVTEVMEVTVVMVDTVAVMAAMEVTVAVMEVMEEVMAVMDTERNIEPSQHKLELRTFYWNVLPDREFLLILLLCYLSKNKHI
ncbi:hypothetical protein MAR_005643 [Mya arenaria]|uniref:Uncharacterized protein n=1 Tax=Mya arenaria TaxID=6604 RepID=A0ABY7F035_MYAAR|nr:hypothetical protein MAR_005643 [Mya arenaria]